MGGRGGKARSRVDQHAPSTPRPIEEDLYVPPDTPPAPEPAPGDPAIEETKEVAVDDTPTEQQAAAAWERVRVGGLTSASKEDLLAAMGAVERVSQRWDIEAELRGRAETEVRHASRAAAEADRTMPDDRAGQVRDAITAVGARLRDGDWMTMSELRAALPQGMTRAEVDATLKRLTRTGEITLTPDPDRKNVNLTDHENAILLGGDFNNLIAWNRPSGTSHDPD